MLFIPGCLGCLRVVFGSAPPFSSLPFLTRWLLFLPDFCSPGAQRTESFFARYQPKEYHYTLYYYDQAGNLVKTIPPAAAKPNYSVAYLDSVKRARASGSDKANYLNNELMATQYRYNTLNAVVAQTSPDGGMSQTWYDRLGRLAVSQNAKQKAAGNYTYVLYDALGRSTEVGQKPQTQFMTQTISGDTTALQNWLNGGGLKEQITRTVYDVQYANGTVITPYLTQLNLRNRVSYVQAIDVETSAYRTATFYSYDVHGNADTVLHDYGANSIMGVANNRFKLIKYDYDLISGKVNMVSYQPDKADGFYQQYRYDAENRLMAVLTSRDSILWQQDATYKYYRHGPLARMELGDLKVQGVDYAFTLQGWLKSINPSYNNLSNDLYDEDGTTPLFARDAYKLNLNYYDDGVYTDYKPINAPAGYVQGNTLPLSVRKSLYNGNISSIATNIRALNQPLLYNYQYDQLNRLVSMDAWKSNGLFAATEATPMQDFAERYTYDPNGNILSLSRNGTTANSHPLAMDNLSYKYLYIKTGNNGTGEYVPGQTLPNDVDHLTNQLASVRDAVGDANYTNDIDNQNANNYSYDQIGNMTSDVKESITNITWSVYGKILGVTKNGNAIIYTYDAVGNRISKKAGSITTWYVRDATGNTLATYVQGDNTKNGGALTQTEVNLYGSSRIGVLNSTLNCSNISQPLQMVFTRGSKQYELNNHLGNVLATISDKKLQVSTDNNQTVAYYSVDVSSANDYYSFGMQMPERTNSASGYRYGFNGIEKDNQIDGSGNHYDALFGDYDSRIGRRWNPDPKPNPSVSFYTVFLNSPISQSDILLDTPTVKEAAQMSNDVYNKFKDRVKISGGWNRIENYKDVTMEDKDVDFQAALYSRIKKDGSTEYTWATAGTASMKDLVSDLKQPLGLSKQYEVSKNEGDYLSNILTDNELTFVGHSLGGGLAALNALSNNRAAFTFNPAGLSKLTLQNFYVDEVKTDNIRVFRIDGEIVGNLQGSVGIKPDGKVTLLKPVTYKWLSYVSQTTYALTQHLMSSVYGSLQNAGYGTFEKENKIEYPNYLPLPKYGPVDRTYVHPVTY